MLLPLTMKLGFFVLTLFHLAPIDVMGIGKGGGGTKSLSSIVSQVLLQNLRARIGLIQLKKESSPTLQHLYNLVAGDLKIRKKVHREIKN